VLSLRIAARFLKKSPIQSALIVAGISVGIAVQIFVGSLIASLQSYLIDQTLGSSPHITIAASKEGKSIQYDDELRELLKKDKRITAILPQCTLSLLYRKGSESAPLSLKGGNPDSLDSIYRLSKNITKGSFKLDDNSILVGKEFAKSYDVSPGDKIKVTLPDGENKTLKINGVFDLGARELNENLVFSNSKFPAEVLGFSSDEYSKIEIQLADVFTSTEVVEEIDKSFSGLKISDWQVEREDLLSGLNAQTSSTIIIQVFIIIAVALGIASTLSVSAIQKTRQIGILKALGMTDARSGTVFLWEGMLLGLFGTGGGVCLGLGLIGLFQWMSSRLETSLFPIEARLSFIAISAAIGIAVAMASAIFPTHRTARLDPIEVIQSG